MAQVPIPVKKEKLQVKTEAEFDVKTTIKQEVEKAVQAAINECSKKYYRTITVDVNICVE